MEKLNKFKQQWEAKIENNRLKVKISEGRNLSKHLTMMTAVNDLRSILDEYSILTFDKFAEIAKGFTEEKFDTIIDEVLDDPSEVIFNETHIPKPDNVRCEIVESGHNWEVKIMGPNKEVKSTYRLLYGLSRLIKHKKIEGTLQKDFNVEEIINRNLEEHQYLWLSVRHFPEEQLTFISYIDNKIEDMQLMEIEGLITSQVVVKQVEKNQSLTKEESKSSREKKKSNKKDHHTSPRKGHKNREKEIFNTVDQQEHGDTYVMCSDDSSDVSSD